ncbi:MAG TPA: glycosyltransferase family 4 protein [Candidatus Acidoferrales bacterium]|nr:glycosyltransferase family 4 protein [Candidatus Acidoferrales bacterium]
MRILHFDTERQWRGGQQQVYLLVEGLGRRGIQATLAAPPDSALFERASRGGLTVRPLAARGDADPAAILRLGRLLRRERFDLLHVHTAHAHGVAAMALRLLPRRLRPRLVVSRRVVFSSASSLTRRKFRRVDCVIAVSLAVRQGLLDAGIDPERVQVVRDGARIGRQAPDPQERERVRRLLGLAPGARLVLHLAHFAEEKGQEDLIAAVPAIRAAVPAAFIAVVGQGALRDRFEGQAATQAGGILFAGFWPPDRVPALMAAAELFVLPSRHEGLGSVLLEAMAAGLPIVATRTGGIPEIVRDGATGLLVPPGDPPALAAAVIRLLSDPALAARLAAGAREFVEREGSAERMIEETVAVYRALAGRRDP